MSRSNCVRVGPRLMSRSKWAHILQTSTETGQKSLRTDQNSKNQPLNLLDSSQVILK